MMRSKISKYVCMGMMAGIAICNGSLTLADEGEERSGSVYSRLKFFTWMMNESPTVNRIADSNDADARQQVESLRELLQQAKQQYDDGRYLQSEENIAEGIRKMSKLSVRIKDMTRVEHARKKIYHELKQHVETFSEVFMRVAEEKNDKNISSMLDQEKLTQVLENAEKHYHDGEYAMANHVMKQAADMVERAVSNARDKDVLVHELNFETPQDEYAYEIKRNESYLLLIDVMQSKTLMSDASVKYMSRAVSDNAIYVDNAKRYASDGDYESAINELEKGVDRLSRAISMAGTSM